MGRTKKPLTFVCEFCGEEVTELAGPGQVPRYCAEHKAEAKANMAKMRMRAMRERQKAAATSPSALGSTQQQKR